MPKSTGRNMGQGKQWDLLIESLSTEKENPLCHKEEGDAYTKKNLHPCRILLNQASFSERIFQSKQGKGP